MNRLITDDGVWDFNNSLVRYRAKNKRRWLYLFDGRQSGARFDRASDIAKILTDPNLFDDDRFVLISDLLKTEGSIYLIKAV